MPGKHSGYPVPVSDVCAASLFAPALAAPGRVVAKAMLHFIVRLCAVVGGVLSITRMADRLVHAFLVASGMVVLPPSIKAKHRWDGIPTHVTPARQGLVTGLRCGVRVQCTCMLRASTKEWGSTAVLKWFLLCCVAGCVVAAGPPPATGEDTAAGATATLAAWTHSVAACQAVGALRMQVRSLRAVAAAGVHPASVGRGSLH